MSARGFTQAQIAAKYGITQQAVAAAIKVYREALPADEKAEQRMLMREFYRENMEAFARIASLGPMPAYSNGRKIIISEDENGENQVVAEDWSTVIKAREAAMHAADSVRKMLGLDDATKIQANGEIEISLKLVGIDVEEL